MKHVLPAHRGNAADRANYTRVGLAGDPASENVSDARTATVRAPAKPRQRWKSLEFRKYGTPGAGCQLPVASNRYMLCT
jgi:hypothetical protein